VLGIDHTDSLPLLKLTQKCGHFWLSSHLNNRARDQQFVFIIILANSSAPLADYRQFSLQPLSAISMGGYALLILLVDAIVFRNGTAAN